MKWWRKFLNWFRALLKIGKDNASELLQRVPETLPQHVYNRLLLKYNLEPNGQNFFALGYAITDPNEAENYAKAYVEDLFNLVEQDFNAEITEAKATVTGRLETIRKEIENAEKLLNPDDETGFLFRIDKLLATVRENEKLMEKTVFPEKEMHRMVNNTLDSYQQTWQAKKNAQQSEPLEAALTQKHILSVAGRLFNFFINKIGRLSAVRHSLLFPPRLRYIIGFLCTCLFLLVAELGFSMTIINNLMDTGFKELDPYFTLYYAVGMTLSFAILFRLLIDLTFHRTKREYQIFVSILLVIFLVLVILFSYNKDETANQNLWPPHISFKGFMLAFFQSPLHWRTPFSSVRLPISIICGFVCKADTIRCGSGGNGKSTFKNGALCC